MYSGLLSNTVKTAAKPAATVAKTAAPAASTAGMSLADYLKWAQQNKRGEALLSYNPEQLARAVGFTGNAEVQTGQNVTEGESGPISTPTYGASPELTAYLQNYRFAPTMDGKNAAVDIYGADGSKVNSGFRVGDHTGTFGKIMSVIPYAAGAVMGAGALGLLPGGAAASGAATAGEAAALTGGADAATSAAWANGAAGLGGDTLTAMGMGEAATGLGGAAAGGFNAALDSQLASNALGITGAQSAAAATVPATVNLGSLGGTMATSGGLGGALNTLGQGIRDATASSNVGGSLLSQAGGSLGNAVSGAGSALNGGTTGGTTGGLAGTAGDVAGWLKANPALGKLLMSGAMGLLSSGGGGSSGGTSSGSTSFGPAKNWTSSIQQGLLTPVQQVAPPALQRPAGLLAQGQANDGAWRYLRG